MTTLPSDTMLLCDGEGAPFGHLRFAPNPDKPGKGDAIVEITDEDSTREEVRWLRKRRFERVGEHGYKIGKDGAVTVSQGDFKLTMIATEQEGEWRSKPPAPYVVGLWLD